MARLYRLTRQALLPLFLALLFVFVADEGSRLYGFYGDLRAAESLLEQIEAQDSLESLVSTPDELAADLEALSAAQTHLNRAAHFAEADPLLVVMSHLPGLGRYARAIQSLVWAARDGTSASLRAAYVLADLRGTASVDRSSIEDALNFLDAHREPMSAVAADLQSARNHVDSIPEALPEPLARARVRLDSGLTRLEGLTRGYEQAVTLLPPFLGYDGPRTYLILPQNDTELFPSGGLISSYGIVALDHGRLVSLSLEYFGTLYDRWQATTREYIEPPAPLKGYLKRDFSWGLGEAGWYPDFPTTAGLASDFVRRGGAPPTDGVIAFDLRFVQKLLEVLGPITVPEYGVTVTAANLYEVSLQFTRDEVYIPGKPKKAFLSHLASAVLPRIFQSPPDRWIDMLTMIDEMGRERHLQLHMHDQAVQEVVASYGFDGSMLQTDGDFLMVADTSVQSTKLNLILQPSIELKTWLSANGVATSFVSYSLTNPFPAWAVGRDVGLVSTLMLDGVYGGYVRVYAPLNSTLLDVRLDGISAGAEQDGRELRKRVFGRFIPVLPGTTGSVQFAYQSPGVVTGVAGDVQEYRLLIQKEAGTGAVPVAIHLALPSGAVLLSATLDGVGVNPADISTDLRTDRVLVVRYWLR